MADVWDLTVLPARYFADAPIRGPVLPGIAAVETLVSNQDAAHIDNSCTVRRTIFVPVENLVDTRVALRNVTATDRQCGDLFGGEGHPTTRDRRVS
jgi:hypothetical protein